MSIDMAMEKSRNPYKCVQERAVTAANLAVFIMLS